MELQEQYLAHDEHSVNGIRVEIISIRLQDP